jgi:hypothetical protein
MLEDKALLVFSAYLASLRPLRLFQSVMACSAVFDFETGSTKKTGLHACRPVAVYPVSPSEYDTGG